MKLKKAVPLLAVISVLVGCISFPRDDVSRAESDIAETYYDTSVVDGDSLRFINDSGFTPIKTVYYSGKHFTYVGGDPESDTIFQPSKDPILSKYIIDAVTKNVGNRFTITTDVADSATADAVMHTVGFQEEYSYYSYYYYWYGYYPYYYYPGSVYVTTYTVGTLLVDIAGKSDRLKADSTNIYNPIWIGMATGLTSNNNSKEVGVRASDLIDKMFIQSPYLKSNN